MLSSRCGRICNNIFHEVAVAALIGIFILFGFVRNGYWHDLPVLDWQPLLYPSSADGCQNFLAQIKALYRALGPIHGLLHITKKTLLYFGCTSWLVCLRSRCL